uniref:Uncharacterized protein n=1 Tax=Arsenophonus endosymbiont of Trialeurodes vaporariorum TaxID=235567 RepID=A0A3B0M6T8_9GAMM
MNKLIVYVFVCVLSGCVTDNRAKRDNSTAKPMDTPSGINDLNAANSDCAHSVEP